MIVGCGENGVATLDCIFPLATTIIYWALIFGGIVALFMIIFGGIRFITSGGDQKTVDTGKKTITYAIVGLILVFLSFFILNLISYITHVACLDPNTILRFTSCQP